MRFAFAGLAAMAISASFAAEPVYKNIATPDKGEQWPGCILDASNKAPGCMASANWKFSDTASIKITGIPRDWTQDGTNALSFWIYSPDAFSERFLLTLYSSNEAYPGEDYYSIWLNANFKGWKQITIPFADFQQNRQPLGWD